MSKITNFSKNPKEEKKILSNSEKNIKYINKMNQK